MFTIGPVTPGQPRRPLVEICTDSLDGSIAVEQAGADRVELCADLPLGGTTPSGGMMTAVCEALTLPVAVMIRPRAGDFLYSEGEREIMRRDIELAKQAGAAAIVLGLLTPDGQVHVAATRDLIERARPLEVTFHRAFDMSREPYEALRALIDLGIDRLLTSGQVADVSAGLALVSELVAAAGAQLSVMPGCGVQEHNAREIIEATGAREIHFSARERRDGGMTFRNPACAMGTPEVPGEFERDATSVDRIRALLDDFFGAHLLDTGSTRAPTRAEMP